MRIEGNSVVEEATAELGISLTDLVALASVWVHPMIYEALQPVAGVWYPDRRRANLGLRIDGNPVEAVGQVIDGVTLDNNTYANTAFKRCLGVDRANFVGFHICHIWPATAYDATCYTNIANLVAIPAELSSLTDHHPHIVACLKYRAWDLYGWRPAKELPPVKPERYPVRWREPWPVSDEARRAAFRRVRGERDFDEDGGMRRDSGVHIQEAVSTAKRSYLSAPGVAEAAILAAFYLSRFDHERLGLGNQGETIDRVARAIGVNRDTLKNYRDYFDSFTGSRRQGWKRPLPAQLHASFPSLMQLDEPTLRRQVLELMEGGTTS